MYLSMLKSAVGLSVLLNCNPVALALKGVNRDACLRADLLLQHKLTQQILKSRKIKIYDFILLMNIENSTFRSFC
jgi:hypothetical protein